ncbi:MAG: replicative DNA helicase [Burkholderiaceae bacterium]
MTEGTLSNDPALARIAEKSLTLMERVSDHEAERATVAACLVDPDAIPGITAAVDVADFHDDRLRALYGAVLDVWGAGAGVNTITVAHRLAEQDLLEGAGGQTFMADIIRALPMSIGAEWYAALVRTAAQRRRLIAMGANMQRAAADPSRMPGEVADDYAAKLTRPSVGHRSLAATAGEIIIAGLGADITEWLDDPGRIRGLPTGFRYLDLLIDGWRKGRVHLIAADTGAGKSLFTQWVARALVRLGFRVLMFTTEMAASEVLERMIFMHAGLDPVLIRGAGVATDEERTLIYDAMQEVNGWPLTIVDVGRVSVGTIAAEVRRRHAAAPIDIVIIDHLEMVTGEGATQAEQYQQITSGIKGVASDEDVPIIAVSHINRAGQGAPELSLGHLKNSGSKEQDADIVIFLQAVDHGAEGLQPMTRHEVQAAIRETGMVKVRVIVEKNRHGAEGSLLTRLDWNRGGRYYQQEG